MTPTQQSSVRRDNSDAHQTAILLAVLLPNAKDIPSQLSVFKDAVAQETTILILPAPEDQPSLLALEDFADKDSSAQATTTVADANLETVLDHVLTKCAQLDSCVTPTTIVVHSDQEEFSDHASTESAQLDTPVELETCAI